MRKIIFLISACALSIVSASAAPADVVTARIVPSDSSLVRNKQIQIGVEIDMPDNVGLLGAYSARLEWDPAVLEFVSVRGGTTDGFDSPTTNTKDVSSGKLLFNQFNASGAQGVVSVLTVVFIAKGNPGDSSVLDIEFSSLDAAETFKSLLPVLTVADGSLTVVSGMEGSVAAGVILSDSNPDQDSRITAAVNIDMSGCSMLLGAYSARLSWDPAVLEFVSADGGATAGFDNPNTNLNNVASGTLQFNQFATSGASGLINVINITFRVKGNPGAVSVLDLEFTTLDASQTFTDLMSILTVNDGSVTVGGEIKLIPNIAVSAASHDFGDLVVDNSLDWTMVVSNTGNADLTVSGISLKHAQFTASPLSFTVSAGKSQDITVTFSPSSAGSFADTLTIASNDPDEETLQIPLTGNGVQPLEKKLEVTSPKGGETWTAGTMQNITWTSTGVENVRIEYSTDTGTTWMEVVDSVEASGGSYTWITPTVKSDNCLVQVTDASDAAVTDRSNGMFTIAPVSITLTSPNGGETWVAWTSRKITWTSSGVTNVKLEYSTNIGSTWIIITNSAPVSALSYELMVPDVESTTCLIRISDAADQKITDTSNAVFIITRLMWSYKLNGKNSSSAIGSDGTIYIRSYGNTYGNLHAINPDGTKKWDFSDDGYAGSSTVIGSDGTIYVGSFENLYAINPDGTEKWNFYAGHGGRVVSSPAIGSDGTIYVGSYDITGNNNTLNNLYAINPDGTKRWMYNAGVSSSPAIGLNGVIYVTSGEKLYAINPYGPKMWDFSAGYGSRVGSSPAIGSDGTIYVGLFINLYAINPDGTKKWSFSTGGGVYSSPAIGSDGTIYIGSDDNKLYAINLDGTKKWDFSTDGGVGSSPAIGSDGTIYVGSDDNKLYAINPDGTKKWDFSTGGDVGSSPAIGSDGTIYFGSYDGYLYALKSGSKGLADSPWPKFHYDLKNTGRSPESIHSIALTSPNGGETWDVGTMQNITWTSYGVTNVKLEYSTNNGSTWTSINTSSSVSPGNFVWTVPNVASMQCLIRVSDASNSSVSDVSDGVFSIFTGILPPNIVVTSPNGGESLNAGTSHNITWTSSGVTNAKLEYSTDNGTSWTQIVDNTDAAAESYTWTVPSLSSTQCLVRISDASDASVVDQSDAVFTIKQPTVTVAAPNGGDVVQVETTRSITWTSSDIDSVKIEYTTDGGASWNTIAASTPASSGSYSWMVPDAPSANCKIRISDYGNLSIADMSDDVFTIQSSVSEKALTLTSPKGSEIWTAGSSHEITWTSSNLDNVKLEYSTDNGTNWTTITTSTSASAGSYTWTVPDISSTQCLIRISDASDASVTDQSNAVFTIKQPMVTVTAPNGGDILQVGTTQSITWTSSDIDSVKIEYTTDGGANWTIIAVSIPASSDSYSWTVPDTPSANCKIRITDCDNPAVTDQSDAVFSIETPPPEKTLALITPDGGEILKVGSTENITWESEEIEKLSIDFSVDGGTTWFTIVAATDAVRKSYSWTVPEIESVSCRVRITDTADSTITDSSSGLFTIEHGPFVDLLAPAEGEVLTVGTGFAITWSYQDVGTLKIEYSSDGGKTWTVIASGIDAATGSYTWTPDTASTACRVRISDTADASLNDESGSFTIVLPYFIRVLSPSTGERWSVGSSHKITWEYKDVSLLTIEYSTDAGKTWKTVESNVSALPGSYLWKMPDEPSTECMVRLSDVAHSDVTGLSSGTFTLFRPLITIAHTPVQVANENSTVPFSALVMSETVIDSVFVYYDVTGSRNFGNKIQLATSDGKNYSGVLPSGIFTAYGLEYYIMAKDVGGNIAQKPEDYGFYSITAHVTQIVSTDVVSGGPDQNAYRMISLPLHPSKASIVEQLAGLFPDGENGPDWRLFRFTPGASTPKEYPDIEGFGPGKAFWLITLNNYLFSAEECTTVTTSEPFSLTVAPGWNDIANPWMFDISWDDKENPSNANLSVLYSYEGSWSDPDNPLLVLEPWKGYSVRNLENRSVVIRLRPLPVTKSTAKPLLTVENVWAVTIIARAGKAVDSGNRFGVRIDADNEWDRFDHVEPPGIGEYVSVLFPHRDWKHYPYDYTVDFRPPVSVSQTWDFAVRTNIPRETVAVEFIGIEQLPYGYSLIDIDKGHEIEPDNDTFSFVSDNTLTERHFRLTVNDSDKPEMPSSKPEYFITATCFPNPFNPQTTIRYELPLPNNVTISVFNVVGQLVKFYYLGYQNQGVHEHVFEAKKLTSGIYIYHINAGYSSVKGKMLYMK